MENNNKRIAFASWVAAFLTGCAYDPIIIHETSNVPLIESTDSTIAPMSPVLVGRHVRKRSISLKQSQQRGVDRRKRLIREDELQMQRLSLEVELLSLENERIRQKTAYQEKYRFKRKISLAATASEALQDRQPQSLASGYKPSAEYFDLTRQK